MLAALAFWLLRIQLPVTGVMELPAGVVEVQAEIRTPPGAHDLEIRGARAGTVLRARAGFDGRALLVCESGRNIRFTGFTVDGNRAALEKRAGLPPYNVPFVRFTRANGVLAEGAAGLRISGVRFENMAGFAVLVSRSQDVTIERVSVRDSGSRNEKGRNNSTGGILLEEGTRGFVVRDCALERIHGNGVWTHSLYTSARNAEGLIAANRFRNIGRDAIQVGHAVRVRVERNRGWYIGFPSAEVDIEGQAIPVAIDTAGNTERCAYVSNRFEEINGKCIDLDGFHDGEVRDNACINPRRAQDYPYGNYGIVMNDANPDMRPEKVRIVANEIDGARYGGIFVIGEGNTVTGNRMRRLNLAHAAQDLLRSGIYLGQGAERPAPARANIIEDNVISGFGMAKRCVAAAPGVRLESNRIARNTCRDE